MCTGVLSCVSYMPRLGLLTERARSIHHPSFAQCLYVMPAEKQKKETAKRARAEPNEDARPSKKQKKQDGKGRGEKPSKEDLAKRKQKDQLLEVSHAPVMLLLFNLKNIIFYNLNSAVKGELTPPPPPPFLPGPISAGQTISPQKTQCLKVKVTARGADRPVARHVPLHFLLLCLCRACHAGHHNLLQQQHLQSVYYVSCITACFQEQLPGLFRGCLYEMHTQ